MKKITLALLLLIGLLATPGLASVSADGTALAATEPVAAAAEPVAKVTAREEQGASAKLPWDTHPLMSDELVPMSGGAFVCNHDPDPGISCEDCCHADANQCRQDCQSVPPWERPQCLVDCEWDRNFCVNAC